MFNTYAHRRPVQHRQRSCIRSTAGIGPRANPIPSVYTADLLQLVKRHQLIPHAYADDTQIYGFCRPADSADLCEKVSACVDEVLAWMASNRLLLNHAKTEVLWCISSRRQHQIQSAGLVRIGTTDVQPVSSIHDLGVYIDAETSMRTNVTAVARACSAALRQIRSVRRSLSRHALLTLVRALIIRRTSLRACTGHETSTLHIVCALLTQPVRPGTTSMVPSTRRSTNTL